MPAYWRSPSPAVQRLKVRTRFFLIFFCLYVYRHFSSRVTLTEFTLISHHGHLLDHLLFFRLNNSGGVLSQLAEERWRLGGIGRRAGAHSAGQGRETHTNQSSVTLKSLAMWFHSLNKSLLDMYVKIVGLHLSILSKGLSRLYIKAA